MSRRLRTNGARTLLLALALAWPLAAQAQSGAAAAALARVETVEFKSRLVGKTLPYSVVLPADYARPRSRASSYPVLYLLHGLGGHYDNWLSKTKLREYATQYRMIIVTPEGGDGWYTDSGTVASDKYESYFIQELISDVEGRFRAFKGRAGRAVAGLSMGGYGALKFGVKYPELFVFVASISGALDPASRSDSNPRNAWGFLRPSIMQTFGEPGSPARAANDLFKLIRELPAARIASLPFLYLDCGTEDGFLTGNREMAAVLLERKIPHEFRQLPGKHDWTYWDQQAREVLRMAAVKMPSMGGRGSGIGGRLFLINKLSAEIHLSGESAKNY